MKKVPFDKQILFAISIIFFTLIGGFQTIFSQAMNKTRQRQPGTVRQVSITIDDLPLGSNLDVMTNISRTLLKKILSSGVPAIAFVVESRVQKSGEVEQRTALLKEWSDAGIELGNHTFSHPNFAETSLSDYEKDVIAGEPISKKILKERGRKLRYFRFPFLTTGPTLEAKREFERFLKTRGYRIAPVTLDSKDYIFATAYAAAKKRGDKKMVRQIQQDYIAYLDQAFSFYEECSRRLFGREIPQIIRIHAMDITKDTYEFLIAMLKNRGYEFVSLDTALKDKAYATRENYVGKDPLSWIQRWAMEKEVTLSAEPNLPGYTAQ